MNIPRWIASVVILSATLPTLARAADEACTGITEKCTADKLYDKTINGTVYSCYDCKQALCKDGGNGGLSGTKTSSVCTEKATTFQPISLDDQASSDGRLAPKPRPLTRPWRRADNEQRPNSEMANPPATPESPREHRNSTDALPFDEADAVFGRRTKGLSAESVTPAASTAPPTEPAMPLPVPAPPTPIPYPDSPLPTPGVSTPEGRSRSKAAVLLPSDLFPVPTENKD